MATHSSILAWEIPWTEEPGGLQSMGFTKSGHVHIIYIYIYPLIKVWEFWFIGRKCWDSQWWSHFCFILTFRFVYCPIPLFLFQPTFSTSSVFYFRNTFLGLPWWSSGWDFAFWCTGCRFNLWPGPMSQLFTWGGQSTGVLTLASFLPKNTRTDLLWNGLIGSPCSPRDSQESSPTKQFKSINSLVLSFHYSPALTSIHDHWKNHSFD